MILDTSYTKIKKSIQNTIHILTNENFYFVLQEYTTTHSHMSKLHKFGTYQVRCYLVIQNITS